MIFDILGWVGMILILLAYYLLSTNKVNNGRTYQIINLLAAVCMGIGVFPKKAWFSFVLEIIWSIIALVALYKIKKNKK